MGPRYVIAATKNEAKSKAVCNDRIKITLPSIATACLAFPAVNACHLINLKVASAICWKHASGWEFVWLCCMEMSPHFYRFLEFISICNNIWVELTVEVSSFSQLLVRKKFWNNELCATWNGPSQPTQPSLPSASIKTVPEIKDLDRHYDTLVVSVRYMLMRYMLMAHWNQVSVTGT